MYLLKSLQNLLPLTKMSKEEMESSGHKWRIVMHGQVEQDPQESTTAMIVQVQWGVLFTRHTEQVLR